MAEQPRLYHWTDEAKQVVPSLPPRIAVDHEMAAPRTLLEKYLIIELLRQLQFFFGISPGLIELLVQIQIWFPIVLSPILPSPCR